MTDVHDATSESASQGSVLRAQGAGREEPEPEVAPRAAWAASAALGFTTLFFVPASILWDNPGEFHATTRVALALALAASLLTTALALAARRLPAQAVGATIGLFTALAGLVWLQSTFLIADVGVLDGSRRHWDLRLTLLSTLAWVGLPAAALAFRRGLMAHLPRIGVALLVVQSVGLAQILQNNPSAFTAPLRFDDAEAFTYARSGNVLLLILDSARRSLFDDVLADPSVRAVLDGFTDYSDTLGGYPTTYASVPLILTGRYYENQEAIDSFVAHAARESLPARLRERGYRVEVYPAAPLPADPQLADNLAPPRITGATLRRLAQATLLAAAPNPVRIGLYETTTVFSSLPTSGFWRDDLDFLNAFEAGFRVVPGAPRFKYYHLPGLHPPYGLNERLEHEHLGEPTLAVAKRVVRADIEILRRWLTRLRGSGIYDEATIIVAGDHGSAWFPEELAAGEGTLRAAQASGLPIGPATPLLLVKLPRRHGPLAESSSAASLADIASTILAAVGDARPVGSGRPLDPNPGEPRRRVFYDHAWDDDWERGSLPALREYEITGTSRDPGAWAATGLVFEPGRRAEALRYRWGDVIDATSATGALSRYARHGLGAPDAAGTWTIGREVVIAIPVAPTTGALRLEATVTPFVGPGVPRQDLMISARDQVVGRFALTEPQRIVVSIPSGPARPELLLSLFLPDAAFPAEVGAGEDVRQLGIQIHDLRVDLIPAAPPGRNRRPVSAAAGR